MKTNKIAPSFFAADFSDTKSTIQLMEKCFVDSIHYDIMDNHFVPNISFGPKISMDVIQKTHLKSDIHLMIDIQKGINDYIKLSPEYITLHLESYKNSLNTFIDQIKSKGIKVGLSLKPATPIAELKPYLSKIDMVLLMSVEPGFSGQKFMPEVFNRIEQLNQLKGNLDFEIQIDGGINRENYIPLLKAGANFLVIGSAFFSDSNPQEWVKSIHAY